MSGTDGNRRPENVSSPLLPGGNLIRAALDRQVMIWSDRGGASRHIGDRWAVRCSGALEEAIGSRWPVPHGESFELIHVIRLDDVPAVSREANAHHLENPDFLLAGRRDSTPKPCLQAVDAKFAADRIKPSQVSAQVVSNLLALEEGATRALVADTVAGLGLAEPDLVRGVFVSPDSELTEHLLRRVTAGRNARVDPEEVVTVPPAPGTLFGGLPQARLIGPLARIDELPVTPRDNLISAVYYFRLACACFHLWNEANKPLLTGAPSDEPPPGRVAAELTARLAGASSAYRLVEDWAADVEPQVRAREAIAEVASLPVRMGDIRVRLERAGASEPRVIRRVRRDLEIAFRARLLETVGEIAADDPRPLTQILNETAKAASGLGPEMRAMLERLAEEAGVSPTAAAGSDTPDTAGGS